MAAGRAIRNFSMLFSTIKGTGLKWTQKVGHNLKVHFKPVPLIDTGTGLPGYEPETLEEEIVCYADKFYSKSSPDHVRSVQETAQSLEKFGHAGVVKFLEWAKQFE